MKRDVSLQRDLSSAVYLTVEKTGVTSVRMSQLEAVNFRVADLSADVVALTQNGREVPFFVEGSGQSATLYFYAEAVTSKSEAPMVYRLSRGTGRVMDTRMAAPTGPASNTGTRVYSWEENAVFWPKSQGEDVWLGPLLLAPDSWELAFEGVLPSAGSGMLAVRFASSTEADVSPDHHAEIRVNGRLVRELFWDGISQQTAEIKLPADALQANGNTLRIETPGDTGAVGEAVYVDWVRLQYESRLDAGAGPLEFASDAENIQVGFQGTEIFILDISQTGSPVRLTKPTVESGSITFQGSGSGSRYVVLQPAEAFRPAVRAATVWPAPLRQPGRGAEYIAILPDKAGFNEAIVPLIEFRRDQGLTAKAVSLAQIYEEFGEGRASLSAVRTFLAYAAAHYEPPPRFVLLVGDAASDLRPSGQADWVPTALVRTQFNGAVPSDTWISAIGPNPERPELAVGRFPAQNTRQLYAMVSKTLAYENAPADIWQRRALLISGEDLQFELITDGLGSQMSESGYDVVRLEISPGDSTHYNIMSAFNRGAALVNFVGHGGEQDWGGEDVFHTNDVEMLENGIRLPILVTFTALNGNFSDSRTISLAESLLWAENGGVVAAIAPSAWSEPLSQFSLSSLFYNAFLDDRAISLGEVLLLAKQRGVENPSLRDVTHTINLLGDPALNLKRP